MNSLNITKLIKTKQKFTRASAPDKEQVERKALGCILHIGAGNGVEVENYLTLKPEKIVLVEASRRLARRLEQKYFQQNVKIINSAVSEEAVDSTFYEVQPFRYSGINKPTALKAVFQNLKVHKVDNVKIISMNEVLQECALHDNQNNVLVMQANGAEYESLASLSKQQLANFSNLVIQIGNQIFFDNAREIDDLVDLLNEKGFQLDSQSRDDAVFSHLVFSHDQFAELEFEIQNLKDVNQKLVNQSKLLEFNIEESKIEIQKNEADLQTIQSDLKNVNQEKETIQTELEEKRVLLAARQQENQGSTEQVKKLQGEKAERVEQIKALQNDKAEQAKRIERLNQECDQLTNQRQEVQSACDNFKQQLEEKHGELLEALEQIRALEESNNSQIKLIESVSQQRDENTELFKKQKAWAESLKLRVEELKVELSDSRRSTQLGQKMHAKSQLDLEHLRSSYAEKLEVERELVDLVEELREKLILASKYYFKFQQEHPELIQQQADNQSEANKLKSGSSHRAK